MIEQKKGSNKNEGSKEDISTNLLKVTKQLYVSSRRGFPRWLELVVKNPSANEGDSREASSIPSLGRAPGGGNGILLQYLCLEKFQGQKNLAGYSLWGHKELDMTEHALTHACTHIH